MEYIFLASNNKIKNNSRNRKLKSNIYYTYVLLIPEE